MLARQGVSKTKSYELESNSNSTPKYNHIYQEPAPTSPIVFASEENACDPWRFSKTAAKAVIPDTRRVIEASHKIGENAGSDYRYDYRYSEVADYLSRPRHHNALLLSFTLSAST